MSLTTQLHNGELAAWCANHMPGTGRVAAGVAAAVADRRAVRPVGTVPSNWWADVGGAFGVRLASLVQPAPPYASLYGLVRAGLVSREWADQQAGEWPTHAQLPASQRWRALEVRPTLSGWLDLGDPVPTVVQRGLEETVLADLLARTRRFYAEHAAPGLLGPPGVEASLARTNWLLNVFEDVYRSGVVGPQLTGLFDGSGVPTVEQLRAAAPEPMVAELVELARQLHTTGALTRLRQLAGNPAGGQPLGIASPVIVPHWADGDLLLTSRNKATLIDAKTVIRAADAERTGRWLWQIVGYAWLDVRDRYRIRTVGLLLARHGVLLTWELDALVEQLIGGRGRPRAARRDFLRLAERLIGEEGAQLPA